tara:strand:- start:3612 stop:5222 length:1611 start_codon:yes stop_codon:yes gene_type:complete
MYKAPLADYQNLLTQYAGDHKDYDLATMQQILQTVGKFSQERLWPSNKIGDQEGIHYTPSEHSVSVPKDFHECYKIICDNGYTATALDPKYGGGGGPWVLHHIISEMLASGNLSLSTCPMLTNGAVTTLIANASDSLKAQYIEPMVSGKFSGSMCLTEPQCGTDLGLIKTLAEPKDDHYLITGQKIWITFGEHDLSDNIIHLVLAKTPNAPDTTKGISLFLVPKYLPDGNRNPVFCGGVEDKMGQHASPTAVLNFDKAQGWLVGEEFHGMKCMFEMMNPARIGVGVQGLAVSEAAYQLAFDFASQRRQSRSLDPKQQDQEHTADIILVHPDIKRMLLIIESTNYAMRHLIAYCGYHQDQNNLDIVDLLTPIIKSYVTEQSLDNVSLAMQLMGGMGYVQDGLCEQLYRDGRITMIYEGTNGIQALDLIGRKIAKDQGKSLMRLLKHLKPTKDIEALINQANTTLLQNTQNPSTIAAIAPSYLKLLAISIQYCLITQDDHAPDSLKTFYTDYILPETKLYLDQLQKGSSSLLDHQKYL